MGNFKTAAKAAFAKTQNKIKDLDGTTEVVATLDKLKKELVKAHESGRINQAQGAAIEGYLMVLLKRKERDYLLYALLSGALLGFVPSLFVQSFVAKCIVGFTGGFVGAFISEKLANKRLNKQLNDVIENSLDIDEVLDAVIV